MSADVIMAVLQTALLGLFRDLATNVITSPLFTRQNINKLINPNKNNSILTIFQSENMQNFDTYNMSSIASL